MAMVEEKGPADEREDYTQDGTVDLKGRPVLRSKTGRWKACYFIVGNVYSLFFFFLLIFTFYPSIKRQIQLGQTSKVAE